MFSPSSLISSIKVQEVHPQRCPPAKPELTSDVLRMKAAGETTKTKRFLSTSYITHKGKKNAVTLPL